MSYKITIQGDHARETFETDSYFLACLDKMSDSGYVYGIGDVLCTGTLEEMLLLYLQVERQVRDFIKQLRNELSDRQRQSERAEDELMEIESKIFRKQYESVSFEREEL